MSSSREYATDQRLDKSFPTRSGHRPARIRFVRHSAGVALFLLVLPLCWSAPAPDLWKPAPVSSADLPSRLAAIDRESVSLPATVRPAAEFQKILLRISGGAPIAEWRADIEKFTKASGEEGMAKALKELALCWEARARMEEIDKSLRQFYRQAVRFPEKLEEVRGELPADARTDPWGENWTYKATAPQGFAKLNGQRYQLGPARHPELSTVSVWLKAKPMAGNWKITPRETGTNKAVEIHTADGKAAVVQAGGRVGDATLAFIGDGWALLADTDRIFAVSY